MVQWQPQFTCGLWLQGESTACCSEQHILHYMWPLTARWECRTVQWPAHFTWGLWLQGENAAWCSDQHTLHYVVFDSKVRVQHGAVTSTLDITCGLWLQGEECSVVLWLAILPSEIKSLVASTRCFHTGDVFNRFRIWSTTVPSILFSCFTRISKACNQMFYKDL